MREKRPPTERFGIITRLFPEEGFGWIRADADPSAPPDTPEEDYFAHAKAFRGASFDDSERFYEGARVRFIATDSPKGPRALGVEAVLGGGSRVEVDGNREVPVVVAIPENEDPAHE